MLVAIRAAIGGLVEAASSVSKHILALTTVGLVELKTVDFGRGICRTLSTSQSLGHKRTTTGVLLLVATLVQLPHTHSDAAPGAAVAQEDSLD